MIINEQLLPADSRAIKPSNIGGVAGGDKFIVRGLLFKLVRDPIIRTEGKRTRDNFVESIGLRIGDWRTAVPIYLYGGLNESYEHAMKAAGHELRGAASYFDAANTLVRNALVPMIILVE